MNVRILAEAQDDLVSGFRFCNECPSGGNEFSAEIIQAGKAAPYNQLPTQLCSKQ